MPGSQSWLGSPDPPAPNAPEQSQPHHGEWGQHGPQDSPPGLTCGVYGVYSVLARGFAVPQTPLEGGTAQLEGTVPWRHRPVLSPPSSLEPPSPRALPSWDQGGPMGSLCPGHPSQPEMQLHLRCALWQDPSMEKRGAQLHCGVWGAQGRVAATPRVASVTCCARSWGCSPSKAPFLQLSLP